MSPLVKQLFDMQNVHIRPIVFKLCVNYPQMVYQEETAKRVWSDNSPIVSRIQL